MQTASHQVGAAPPPISKLSERLRVASARALFLNAHVLGGRRGAQAEVNRRARRGMQAPRAQWRAPARFAAICRLGRKTRDAAEIA